MKIESVEALEAVYREPVPPPALKTASDHLAPPFAKLVEASPFFMMATAGSGGLDCTARGDPAGFVRVRDSKTLIFPDRRGNNKIDSLRNIVQDPRVALTFLYPGTGTILRVVGRASITTDEALLQSFAVGNMLPRTVIEVTVDEVFFQCSRAVLRSGLWDAEKHIDASTIPTIGDVLNYFSETDEGKQVDAYLASHLSRELY